MEYNHWRMISVRAKERWRKLIMHRWHKYIIGAKRWRKINLDGILYLVQYAGMGKVLLLEQSVPEREQLEYLQRLMMSVGCKYFIDVGANIGTYALPIATSACVKKTFAIEGSYQTYGALCKNILLNSLETEIETINAVISNTARELTFYDHTELGSCGSGADEILSRDYHWPEKFTARQVKSMTLDQLFSFQAQTIAIKVDVEGHEHNVLEGAQKLLSNNNVIMQIEIWPENASTLCWLFEHGYRVLYRIYDDFFLRNF